MVIDLSVPLEEGMPTFPGTPEFESEQLTSHEEAGTVVHYVSMNTHHGTHIDAPAHYISDGKTIEALDLDLFSGLARVVDLRSYRGEPITADILESEASQIEPGDRVLLLTGDVDTSFYDDDFFEKVAHLTVDGAEWLVERDVSLLGNDFLTEAVPGDPARPVHHTLLDAGIPIVEYLCNADAIADWPKVEFTAYPLYLAGLEASPARAVAHDIR